MSIRDNVPVLFTLVTMLLIAGQSATAQTAGGNCKNWMLASYTAEPGSTRAVCDRLDNTLGVRTKYNSKGCWICVGSDWIASQPSGTASPGTSAFAKGSKGFTNPCANPPSNQRTGVLEFHYPGAMDFVIEYENSYFCAPNVRDKFYRFEGDLYRYDCKPGTRCAKRYHYRQENKVTLASGAPATKVKKIDMHTGKAIGSPTIRYVPD